MPLIDLPNTWSSIDETLIPISAGIKKITLSPGGWGMESTQQKS